MQFLQKNSHEDEQLYVQSTDNEEEDTTEVEVPSTISFEKTTIPPTEELSPGKFNVHFDFKDPGTWPANILDGERCLIVDKILNEGKLKPNLSNTIRDGRHLTQDWFYKKLPNGQMVCRSWLAYSMSKNALFCIPCRLFSDKFSEQALSRMAKDEGLTQWKKLNEKIPQHENSLSHKKCFCSWKTLEMSLNKGGINKELQIQISQEESHWKSVLYVIVDVIIHLAKQGSPLRGSDESLDFGDPRSGRFLNTIDLLSRYHLSLREHINRHKKGQISYFSHIIQNEFLEIIATKIRDKILSDTKEAKYFSVMFDCTPDVSHLEQMSQVIRYVKLSENGPEICESFIDFLTVGEKTGLALSELIVNKIESSGLDFKNCRGQSYDNGSNMAGKYKGVQARLKEENDLAYFVPCSAHSLNLVGVNAASVSHEAETYFGTLNCLYSFFAASTNRWEVLVNHIPVSLKLQSSTRWSTKREAVAVIYKHIGGIIDALNDLMSSLTSSSETKTEASNLLRNIRTFDFVAFTCFWYKELSRIDIVNKLLQRKDMTIDRSVKHINRLIQELEADRASNASDAVCDAKTIAGGLNLDTQFKEARKRKKKRMVDEDCEDESCEWTAEKKFNTLVLQIIDRILSELRRRFKALQDINTLFGFLYGNQLQSMTDEDLKARATELASTYKCDLDKDELLIEVHSFKYHALDLAPIMTEATPAELLSSIYKNGLEDAYPNVTTALKILLTMPVSVASNERSFSKLKLIKTYLRNRTTQQRLTHLSIIHIEHEFASKLSFDDIIDSFASRKARKVKF